MGRGGPAGDQSSRTSRLLREEGPTANKQNRSAMIPTLQEALAPQSPLLVWGDGSLRFRMKMSRRNCCVCSHRAGC